jgi:hypothetical protein
MKHLSVYVLVLVSLAACTTYTAPTPAPERQPTAVVAPFDSTWQAVIDVFATRNIPIATIDKSSGIIVAQRLAVGATDALKYANCGVVETLGQRAPYYATGGDFNVLVRSSGDGSTVRVTASWRSEGGERSPMACQTTGQFETVLETSIRDAAQRP